MTISGRMALSAAPVHLLVDHHLPEDSVAMDVMVVAARRTGCPVVTTGAIHYAASRQARLAQALAALRCREDLDHAAGHLMPAPTAHLRCRAEMQQALARYPGVLEATIELGHALVIDLDELRPELPGAPTPRDFTEDAWLHYLAERACTARYGDRDDPSAGDAWRQPDHELTVIAELGMAGYFLIVRNLPVRHRPRDLVPRPRFGGQFPGLLRTADHVGQRPAARRPAVRAVPIE